jgi:hypothetical protein
MGTVMPCLTSPHVLVSKSKYVPVFMLFGPQGRLKTVHVSLGVGVLPACENQSPRSYHLAAVDMTVNLVVNLTLSKGEVKLSVTLPSVTEEPGVI